MKIISTDHLPQSETERLWAYNALDCMVTHEVFGVIKDQLDNLSRSTYEFSKSLQAPVLDMKLRGVRIDQTRRANAIRSLETSISTIKANFDRILKDGFDLSPVNAISHAQVKALLYGFLRLPPRFKDGSPTVNREALESLQSYFIAQPLINHILEIRDLTKTLGILKSEIDPDGRFRTSYNIAGTTTGRFSSNVSDLGTGSNSQNIDPRLRSIFVADPGMKMAYIDLEQAESRAVGAIEWNLFQDATYLDACESGDLHTTVTKLVWPDLGWNGDPKHDKEIAKQIFYRQHSYRQASKVLGHGSNYKGGPEKLHRETRIDLKLIREFQPKYFGAFPGHLRWHAHVTAALARDGFLVSLVGRRRHFFGRLADPATIREAVAFDPQSSVADILNTGLLQVWRQGLCDLLLQVHDAILVQYPEPREAEVLPQILKAIIVPVELQHGRTLRIPSEAKVGWNWGEYCCGDKSKCKQCKLETNLDGLKAWEGVDDRRRSERLF